MQNTASVHDDATPSVLTVFQIEIDGIPTDERYLTEAEADAYLSRFNAPESHPAISPLATVKPVRYEPVEKPVAASEFSERSYWILQGERRVEAFAGLMDAINYVQAHRDCCIVRLMLDAPDSVPDPSSDEAIQARLEENRKRFNPLAESLWNEHLQQIQDVEHLLPEGVELSANPGCKVGRPSTDDECRFAWLEFDREDIDLTGDIPGQLADRLENLALSFLQSALWLRNPPVDDDESSAETRELELQTV